MNVKTNLSILKAENEWEEEAFIIIDKESNFSAFVTAPTAIYGTGLFTRNANFGYGNEDNFEADWAGTIIYDQPNDPSNYLYYEQDPVRTALHNYLSMVEAAKKEKESAIA